MRYLAVAAWLATFAPAAVALAQPAAPITAGPITAEPIHTLEDALRLGEARSPRLRAAESRHAAARGERRQAAALPNPELFADAENIAGSGVAAGGRGAEVTAGIAQTFELGGKRAARIGAADADLAVAAADLRAAALDLRRDIAVAFVEALGATRMATVESRRLENASAVAAAVDERVRQGREPPMQASKAAIALATAETGRQRADREREARMAAFAAALGVPAAAIADSGWFDRVAPVPPVDLEAALQANPAVARLDPLRARARAAAAREAARAVPDLTVRAGVRHERDSDSTGLVVGFSVPIPVFDANRGGIERAGHELAGAEADAEALRRALAGTLAEARHRLEAARQAVETLRTRIVPAAADVLAAAQEGYAAGKFGFLDLLDAQRTRFDADAQLADALMDYHLARIALMRASGGTY